jgi:DNA (cytosine-5)-methyltransferase 1
VRAVDLFAGWGGFSAGAAAAGVDVVWAANHWQLAVDAHAANHPRTRHVCQDLRQADWSTLPAYDLLLAAPACQGHSQAAQPSRARSDRTRRYHDSLRATAWAVVDCADVTEPRAIVVENVHDFARWRLYPQWRAALEALGYAVTENRIMATAYGVPQRRDRLFVVATRGPALELHPPRPRREPAIGPRIEWNRGDWRSIRDARGAAARRRLAAAARSFDRAIVQHVSHHRGLPVTEPIRTITTKDQWCVLRGREYRPLSIRETARAMGFADSYHWPDSATRRESITGLGNAVCPPVARGIVERVAGSI